MNARIFLLFVTVTTAFGCSIGVGPTDDQLEAEPAPLETYDTVFNFGNDQAEDQLNTGQWEIKNGSMICHGYLMRVESENYCSATVPDDWTPFTYDGQTYYIQPLAGS